MLSLISSRIPRGILTYFRFCPFNIVTHHSHGILHMKLPFVNQKWHMDPPVANSGSDFSNLLDDLLVKQTIDGHLMFPSNGIIPTRQRGRGSEKLFHISR